METSWDALRPELLASTRTTIRRLGFTAMTPVQASCIPLFLQKKDVAAEAVTGSGKTLAFVIPIIEMIAALSETPKKHDVVAVIISPTRELAVQISEVLEEFLKDVEGALTQLLLIGGSPVSKDIAAFEENGGNILVATPGRLEDILNGKTTGGSSQAKMKSALKSLEILILDEADRLLSLGFERAVDSIISFLPKLRRTGLFSATQTKEVTKLIRAGLRNPVLVSVKEKDAGNWHQKTPSTLTNRYVVCEPRHKFATLVAFLRSLPKDEKAILFFSTCACVEYFSLMLSRLVKGINILSIHGKKTNRHKVFEDFRKLDSGLLVCTDVMARGVDIPDVNWVLQFDPPSNAEAFVHRCGRTARIGKQGSALLFLLPSEDAYIDFIARNQKVELDRMDPPDVDFDLLPKLRDWQRNDRNVFDKANRAFVSNIQAYSKHECKFVLPIKDLPFGELATSFGLLKMPKMPELKKRKVVGFVPDSANTNDIKYTDKQKERSRQEKLSVFAETGLWPGAKERPKQDTAAWSEKASRKRRRDLRREVKQAKREAKKEAVQSQEEEEEDLDDLEDDYRMLKKIKKGKATNDDFDRRIDLEEDCDDEDSD